MNQNDSLTATEFSESSALPNGCRCFTGAKTKASKNQLETLIDQLNSNGHGPQSNSASLEDELCTTLKTCCEATIKDGFQYCHEAHNILRLIKLPSFELKAKLNQLENDLFSLYTAAQAARQQAREEEMQAVQERRRVW